MYPSMNSQRHLHFVQSIEPLQGGGLGAAALQLASAMRDHGADAHLITTYGEKPQAPGNPIVTELKRSGPDRIYYSHGLLSTAKPLIKDFHVFHEHGFYVATSWLLGRQARKLGRPIVCHAHGFFEPWILARSHARKKAAHLLFEDANFRAASLWRALTAKEADQIRQQGIRAPIVVAANGIHLNELDADTEAIRNAKSGKKDRRRALFLARLHPKKGLDLLIQAWHRAGAAAAGWELIIAGPDELGHRAEMEHLTQSLGLTDSVRFVGPVTGAEKNALLRSADLFVLPSRSEGFSVAILEALASRIPVIATEACNFPELARDGGGWQTDVSVESITDSLSAAIQCGDLERQDRGRAARQLVEDRYTWPSITAAILDATRQHCTA